MDKYSQRNCRKNGMTLLKTSGKRLLVKRYGYSRWKELSVKIEDLKTIDDYADRLSKQSTKIDAAKVRIVKAFETLRLATDRTTESLNELDFSQMMDTLTKLDLSRPID